MQTHLKNPICIYLYMIFIFSTSLEAGTVYQITNTSGSTASVGTWTGDDITILSIGGFESTRIPAGRPLYVGYTWENSNVVGTTTGSIYLNSDLTVPLVFNSGGVYKSSGGTQTITGNIQVNGQATLGANGWQKRILVTGAISGDTSSKINITASNKDGSTNSAYNCISIDSANNSFSGTWIVGQDAAGGSVNTRFCATKENGLGKGSTLNIHPSSTWYGDDRYTGPVKVEITAAQEIANLTIEARNHSDNDSALVVNSNVPFTVTGTTTLKGGTNLISLNLISNTPIATISLGDLVITGNAETYEWWNLSARNMRIDAGSQYTLHGANLNVSENLTVSQGSTLAIGLRYSMAEMLTLSKTGVHTLAGTLQLYHNNSDVWDASKVYSLSNVDLTGFANVVWEDQMKDAGMQLLYRNGVSVVSRPWVFTNDATTSGTAWNGDDYGARDVRVIRTGMDSGFGSNSIPSHPSDIYLGYALSSGGDLLPSNNDSATGRIYMNGNLTGKKFLAYRGGIYHAKDGNSLDLRGELILAENAIFGLGANGADRTLNVHASIAGDATSAISITADTKQQGGPSPERHVNNVALHSENNSFEGTWNVGISTGNNQREARLDIFGENALGNNSTLIIHSPHPSTNATIVQENYGPVTVNVHKSQEVKSLEIREKAKLNLHSGTFTVRESLDIQPEAVIDLVLGKALLEFTGEDGTFSGELNLLWDDSAEIDLFSIYDFLKSGYLGNLAEMVTVPDAFTAMGMGVHYRNGAYALLNPAAVPEPGTWGMLLLGILGYGILLARKRKEK